MAFHATIEDTESKSLWSKCINSLNSFQNEHIKFIISRSRLTISTLNQTHTSHGEIQFDKSFFKSYQFNSDYLDPTNEGYSKDSNNEVSFTFAIRSKLISMVFKKNEELDVESIKLSLNDENNNNAESDGGFIGQFRLHIEIKTKSLIRKEYNIYYIPCKNDTLKISKTYKEAFYKLQRREIEGIRYDDYPEGNLPEDDEDEINYLMINNNILKNFLDNVSSTTEDFKFEVNSRKFSLTAFTKGIFVKEKEILKQPMAINISFSTDELLDLKLFKESNGLILDKKIIFRLKDFKNFLNLGLNNEYCEIWFKKSGDPILFEIIKNSILIQFTQITDGDQIGGYHNDKKLLKNVSVIPRRETHTTTNKNNQTQDPEPYINQSESITQPLFIHDEEAEKQSQQSQNNNNDDDQSNGYNDDYEPQIRWNDNDHEKLKNLMANNEKDIVKEAKAKYIEEMNKKRRLNTSKNNVNEEEEEEELGPTQNVTKIKGIFD